MNQDQKNIQAATPKDKDQKNPNPEKEDDQKQWIMVEQNESGLFHLTTNIKQRIAVMQILRQLADNINTDIITSNTMRIINEQVQNLQGSMNRSPIVDPFTQKPYKK